MANSPHTHIETAKSNVTNNNLKELSQANVADSFWDVAADIDGARWNQQFPYQLIVVEPSGDGYVRVQPEWSFTLPIPPQDLSISTPFAITTSATLGGIVEEHNGAPIRNISFSGTTGLMPMKGIAFAAKPQNVGPAIFAGVINSATSTARSFQTLIGNPTFYPNLITDVDKELEQTTGYYQFRLLQNFFEGYIAAKKRKEFSHIRLALAIWKDEAIYLVTPTNFDVRRSATSPREYSYSVSFRAWKRIKLDNVPPAFEPVVSNVRDPNVLAKVLNKISQARDVLQNARVTIQAIGREVDSDVFEPLRQVALFVKDAVGVPVALLDLPIDIIINSRSAILELASLNGVTNGLVNRFNNFDDNVSAVVQSIKNEVRLLSITTDKAVTGGNDLRQMHYILQGGVADPGNDPINNPYDPDNYNALKDIKVGELNLPPEVIRAISNEKQNARALRREDFERIRDNFRIFAANYADFIGAGGATYNRIYNRTVATNTRTPTDAEFDVLYALNNVILELNRLAASGPRPKSKVTALELVAGAATRSGIAFTVPTSKFQVPMPYGMTLEQLSLRYLGTPDRWHEIAALNGLREPYIDEIGFTESLLVNGSDNIVVTNYNSDFYVGQTVAIGSSTILRDSRHILRLEKRNNGQMAITLDGEADLEKYKTNAAAYIHGFLPNTVNSQMVIYIPSASTPDVDDSDRKAIPDVNYYENYIDVSGIDLLLTSTNDLVITSNGETRWAYGITQLTQKARIALSTVQGSLLHHPEYGFGIKVGTSTADAPVSELLAAAKRLFAHDPSFSGVAGASIYKNGNALSINLQLGIANSHSLLPITFDVTK